MIGSQDLGNEGIMIFFLTKFPTVVTIDALMAYTYSAQGICPDIYLRNRFIQALIKEAK